MPDAKTRRAVAKDKRKGKSASTQAGEFVREEIEHIRKGKHGAKNTQQAIAIGLSKARRAGIEVEPGKNAPTAVKKKARQDIAKGRKRAAPSPTRAAAAEKALKSVSKKAAKKTVSKSALAKQAKKAAGKRTAADRSAAAKKGARTKGPAVRKAAARKAARTRAAHYGGQTLH